MRRSVEEGVNSRFVTGERVEALLKVSFKLALVDRLEMNPFFRKCPTLLHLARRNIWTVP